MHVSSHKNLKDFKSSIPNKIYDALSHGVPIITSLEGEVKKLIDGHEVGIHYKNDKDLCIKFDKILLDKLKEKMSFNSKIYLKKTINLMWSIINLLRLSIENNLNKFELEKYENIARQNLL